MTKLKIWYYTTIDSEDNDAKVFDDYPDEIEHEGKKRKIRLTKDYYENITKDLDYGD
jgi:hypothetical protein